MTRIARPLALTGLGLLLVTACNHLASRPENLSSPVRLPSQSSVQTIRFHDQERMDLDRLRAEAFRLCQSDFVPPEIEPIPVLDPPKSDDSPGMVYQEELAVRTKNLLDRDGFYFSPRPRAAVNKLGMDMFVESGEHGLYARKSWADAQPDFSSPDIRPPIDARQIPETGRVLTELVVGHRSPKGDYPQLFDLRSSGYFRFAGYPPQVTGASLRLGSYRIFGKSGLDSHSAPEEFPIVRAVFASIKDPSNAQALLLVENKTFCEAIHLEMHEGVNANVTVDTSLYMRKDFHWQEEPHTALATFSSMYWLGYTEYKEGPVSGAHDSDTLRVRYADGSRKKYPIRPPKEGLRIRDIAALDGKGEIKEWVLSNEDRDPKHYVDFEQILGATNYQHRASYKVAILESNVKTGLSLYEDATNGEYNDNIVAAGTLRQDIARPTNENEAVHFKYRVTSFYP